MVENHHGDAITQTSAQVEPRTETCAFFFLAQTHLHWTVMLQNVPRESAEEVGGGSAGWRGRAEGW